MNITIMLHTAAAASLTTSSASINFVTSEPEKCFQSTMDHFVVLGDKTTTHDDKTIIKSVQDQNFTSSYGNMLIPSTEDCICEWAIQKNQGNSVRFGVSSATASSNVCCFDRNDFYNYSYSAYSGKDNPWEAKRNMLRKSMVEM